MDKIKLGLADDHKLFRDGLKSIINSSELYEIAFDVDNGDDVFTHLKIHTDVKTVLVDISMPGLSGIEVVQQAKEQFPDVKFIILTMHDDGQYVVQSVRSGAHGYLLKNVDEEELLLAIRTVVSGKKYFNSEISELMYTNMANVEEPTKQLSTRETEVLQLVANGETTKIIADKLCISTRTVETHRVNMMKKLNVQNTAELIKKASSLNLL